MEIKVLNKKGQPTTKVFSLSKDVFENEAHPSILRQAIHVHLVNSRTGTAKAKNRGEVSGTGRKPWHNNKTGNARTGDRQTPIFVGGGVSHGPVPMNYSIKFPAKMKKTALKLALTQSVKNKRFMIIEDITIDSDRLTKSANDIVVALQDNADALMKNAIIYYANGDISLVRAFRNIPGVTLLPAAHMNAYDIVRASDVVVMESAMESLNGTKAEKKTAAPKAETKVAEKTTTKKAEPKSTVSKVSVKSAAKPAAKTVSKRTTKAK